MSRIAASIYRFCPQLWHRLLQSSRSPQSAHEVVTRGSCGLLIGSSRKSFINRADALCYITTAVRCFSGRSGRKAITRTSSTIEEAVSDLDKGTVETSSSSSIGGGSSRSSSSNWSFERIDLGSLGNIFII